jgi:hypothetical protein
MRQAAYLPWRNRALTQTGAENQKEISMIKLMQSTLVAAVLLTGASAVSAQTRDVPHENGAVRSQLNLNSPEGAKAFWESVERNGS